MTTLQEEIAAVRKARHAAVAKDIIETEDRYSVIARRHGVSLATVNIIARVHQIRRQADRLNTKAESND